MDPSKNIQEKGRRFIEKSKKRFNFETRNELVLYLVAKLGEETGELTDEILGDIELQRPSKLEKRNKHNLGEEFADMFVVLAALAEVTNIDLDEIIEERLTKIKHPGE